MGILAEIQKRPAVVLSGAGAALEFCRRQRVLITDADLQDPRKSGFCALGDQRVWPPAA
jgi:hypothetical protein